MQIFKHRKDNPDLGRDQIVIGSYYINSLVDYDRKIPTIINICNSENARAYLRINKRNYKKLAPHFLKRVVEIIFTENCMALSATFDSIAGEFHSDPNKKWIVDLDFVNDELETEILEYLKELQITSHRFPMLEIVPTKNGKDIITNPFNSQDFKSQYPEISVS